MELIYTWKELKTAQDRIKTIAARTDEICDKHQGAFGPFRAEYNRLWQEHHELQDRVEKMRRQTIPEVGMPCTVIFYSDRSAAKVTNILSPKCIEVKMCGIYSGKKVFTYRSNGHWVEKGTTSRDWGTLLGIGFQENHFDMEY